MSQTISEIDVSVVIAVRNEEVYVESAVSSVLNQEGLSAEVIVVDDGSTDKTFEILSVLARKHPKLRLEHNPKVGKCSAFNFGVSLAIGRFVCIFAGDDIMLNSSLAARWAAVRDFPTDIPVVGLCKLITLSDIKRFDGQVLPRKGGRGSFSGQSYMMNRLALDKIFPVPETLPNEDTWMETAALHFPGWGIVHSDIVALAWRVHDGNSINLMAGFEEYNREITARYRAYSLFLDVHGAELTPDSRERLRGKVECENCRARGDVIGVLRSRVDIVERLRALSKSKAFFYGIRRHFYKLCSGW